MSVVNIEIGYNEIYGWSEAAVRVNDCDGKEWCPAGGRMLPSENPNAVRIHDNYIHHNQRAGREGYGVSINVGAYALIERNVFDWNRHAIKGGGSPGTGYAAYRNLVLKNGGYHDTYDACDMPTWVVLLSPAAAAAKALCLLGIAPSIRITRTSSICTGRRPASRAFGLRRRRAFDVHPPQHVPVYRRERDQAARHTRGRDVYRRQRVCP